MAVPLRFLNVLFEPFVADSVRTWRILEHLSSATYSAFRQVRPIPGDRTELQFYLKAHQWLDEMLDIAFEEADEAIYNALYDFPRLPFIRAAAQWLSSRATFSNDERVEKRMLEHWIIDCTVRVGADFDTLRGPLLSEYKYQPRHDGDWTLTEEDGQTPFPELTMVFRSLFSHTLQRTGSTILADDDVYHVLRELIRFGVNLTDGILAGSESHEGNLRTSIHTDRFGAGIARAERAFTEMIRNPFAEAPLHVRCILANFHVYSATHHLLRSTGMNDHNYQHIFDDELATLNFAVYKWIIESAVCPETDGDGKIRQAVERRFPSTWKVDRPALYPRYFRPLDLPNEMSRLLPGYERFDEPDTWDDVWVNHELIDLPVEATGSKNDPLAVASACDTLAKENSCPICLEEISNTTEERGVKLNACGHMLHLQCLDSWINTAQKVRIVSCPYCRADICSSRACRAVT